MNVQNQKKLSIKNLAIAAGVATASLIFSLPVLAQSTTGGGQMNNGASTTGSDQYNTGGSTTGGGQYNNGGATTGSDQYNTGGSTTGDSQYNNASGDNTGNGGASGGGVRALW